MNIVTPAAGNLAPAILPEIRLSLGLEDCDSKEMNRQLKLARRVIEHIELRTNRVFETVEFSQTYPFFPCGRLEFVKSPFIEISAVEFRDGDNVEQEFTDYWLMAPGRQRAWIQPKNGWPATYCRPDAVIVTYTAGWSPVPYTFMEAVCLLFGHWNENREATITGTISKEIEIGFENCLTILRDKTYT